MELNENLFVRCMDIIGTNAILVVPCTDMLEKNKNIDLTFAVMMRANDTLVVPCIDTMGLVTNLVVSCTDFKDNICTFVCSLHWYDGE